MKKLNVKFCSMCGAINRDFWETRPTKSVVLNLRPRYGDIGQFWLICDECDEGLQNLTNQNDSASSRRLHEL